MKLAGDYLGEESPICLSMGSWPRHIDRFERQYGKVFARDTLFGADLMDQIHKRVQMFLHSYNTTAIEEVESVALTEFGGHQKKVERGEWLTSTPVWVERPALKEEGRQKSGGNRLEARQGGGGGGGGAVFNHGFNP